MNCDPWKCQQCGARIGLAERLRGFADKFADPPFWMAAQTLRDASEAMRATQAWIVELEDVLRLAESHIVGAVPKLARDRKEAVEVVLPRIRAVLPGAKESA